MEKLINSIKGQFKEIGKYYYFLFFLTIFLISCQKEKHPSEIVRINNFKIDTIFNNKKAILTYKFHNEMDTIKICGIYKYEEEDFSFLYADLLKEKIIFFNNKIPILRGKAPYFNDYRLYSNYNSIFSYKDTKNFIIFSKPLFCNGFYCSSISVLVICEMKDSLSMYEVNTNFTSIDTLSKIITNNFTKTKKLDIPIK